MGIGLYTPDEQPERRSIQQSLFPTKPMPQNSNCIIGQISISDGLLGDKAFVDKAKELLARLKETCPAFLFSNNILKTEHEISLVNDVGLDLSYRAGVYQLDLVMKE